MSRQYLRVTPTNWHPDSLRTFVATGPTLPPMCAPLLDGSGEELGGVSKVWRTLDGRPTAVRIKLVACPDPEKLRAEVLAHRTNIAVDADGCMRLAPAISTAALRDMPQAAPTSVAAGAAARPTWPPVLRVVASRG
jgi:hypothetical protein